jgi:IclR family acetate operon transcriptional repressor
VLDEGQVLYIAIAHAQRELGIQSQAGARHPVHCTALGKALLAELDWHDARAVLRQHGMPRRTDRTVTTLTAMQRELQRIREQGYAVDNEERVPDVVCVAAAMRDAGGTAVGAVSISGPAFRVRDQLQVLSASVLAAASTGSHRLGAART